MYLANSSAQDTTYEVTVSTTYYGSAPFELTLMDLGLSNAQTDSETHNVGTTLTTVKTIELDQLDLGEAPLSVLLIEVQPTDDDDLDLKVFSLDDSGNQMNELTCAPAINGGAVSYTHLTLPTKA